MLTAGRELFINSYHTTTPVCLNYLLFFLGCLTYLFNEELIENTEFVSSSQITIENIRSTIISFITPQWTTFIHFIQKENCYWQIKESFISLRHFVKVYRFVYRQTFPRNSPYQFYVIGKWARRESCVDNAMYLTVQWSLNLSTLFLNFVMITKRISSKTDLVHFFSSTGKSG